MKISANIICKNEQENIKACIESVIPYVDEIIVIDTGSTDKTLEILKNLPVKVIQKEWTNNFAEMRNFAIEQSSNDWIFAIDADMTVLNFPKIDFNSDYYLGDVTILTKSKNLVAFPMIFLFRNKFRYKGQRHATIEADIQDSKGEYINLIVSHPELSREEIQKKMEGNLKIHLQQLKSEPENPTVIYHLFRTYYYLKDYDNAIKYGIDVLNSTLNTQTKAMTGIFMYVCYINKNQRDIGIPYLTHSIDLMPYQTFGRCLMFDLFCEFGNKELASETLEEIKLFSKTRKSDLPCDYFLNEKQIKELETKLKEIQCQITEQ